MLSPGENVNALAWRPTPEEIERDREAVRELYASAGWPVELADPRQETIVIRGEWGWISGPC